MNEKIRVWSAEPLVADVKKALERLAASDDVVHVAAMPDVHLAEDVCVGTVVATTHLLYPNAVGGDIGCGMAALRVTATTDEVDRPDVAAAILAGFERRVPVMAHRAPQALPEALSASLGTDGLDKEAMRNAPRQIGTLGRGNHFLELQVDDNDDVWITVHSGSRGMGQAIRDHALRESERSNVGLGFVDAGSAVGRGYLAGVAWARAFAEESRKRILRAASEVLHDVLGAVPIEESVITCEHNHVEPAVDGDERLWVHRKGAIPAPEGKPGIIPGSMGATTYHVTGRGCREALWSSSHGAGRAMSRTEARRRIRVVDLERDVRGLWFDHRKARALVDEAPGAYKDITKVMRAQNELTRIVRTLRPLVSYKGV